MWKQYWIRPNKSTLEARFSDRAIEDFRSTRVEDFNVLVDSPRLIVFTDNGDLFVLVKES